MLNELTLYQGETELALRADLGGAISRYCTRRGDQQSHWLRPLVPASADDVLASACFPLVPFFGSVRDGRFRFGDHAVRLPANFPPSRHPLHGQGWRAGWEVRETARHRAVLEYRHAADAWPWDYLARQTFALDPDFLMVEVSLQNLDRAAMPAGIGLHPYFPRTPRALVRAEVRDIWETDGEVMPTGRVPAAPHFALHEGVEVDRRTINNVFSGWNGRAAIEWPERGECVSIEAEPPLVHLVVYAPPGESFFCVEPVSNVSDAFNLLARGEEGHGVRVLLPGETLTCRVRFRPGGFSPSSSRASPASSRASG